jgi:MarR family transcriptional regulator, organic hydroperoxide resistance regulator
MGKGGWRQMRQCSNDQIEKIVELWKQMLKGFREAASMKFKEHGFTVTQLSLMFILYRDPNIMLNELSERMGLSKSTVSSMVERLEKQGVVVRKIPKDNRRIVRLSLEQAFVEKHKDILEFKNKFINDIFKFQDTSMEDADRVIYALEKMITMIQ